MKSIPETLAKLRQRFVRECEAVLAEREVLEATAAQHLRYVDSQKRNRSHWKRLNYLVRLLGPQRAAEMIRSDKTGIFQVGEDKLAHFSDAKKSLPVWKAMREFLCEEGESKVSDIQAFLLLMDDKAYHNVTRQTIESAIKRHSDTFRVRSARHERFVSLKENDVTESSSDDD